MDVTDNDSFPMNSPLPERETAARQGWGGEHPSEPTDAGDRLESSAREMPESARRLAYASEVREVKIRELQDAIKNGTYDVPAEQIADKMLRDPLHNHLP
jgi:flagellar biosynthesis anti-sigma factor FlgM